jgi:ATP-dependent RNA helicase DDX18/HAS1
MKGVYDVNTLDIQQVAKSFGFKVAPFIDLGISAGKKFATKRRQGSSGYSNDKASKKARIYRNV